jgi:hypothetical protein
MSCNNTNSTCSNCSNNYSSCNNKCAKCGCRDSFLTSPPPCPTPAGCPDPIPCQEVLSSDCIIYNGPDLLCNGDIIVYQDATWTELLENIIEYFCLPPIPEITCNGDIVVQGDSSISDALEDIVNYFCDVTLPTYTKYVALISQTGTADPTVFELENTIGPIVWTRIGAGAYEGTLTGAFTVNKTYSILSVSLPNIFVRINGHTINIIRMATHDISGTGADNLLNRNSLEIRIYP